MVSFGQNLDRMQSISRTGRVIVDQRCRVGALCSLLFGESIKSSSYLYILKEIILGLLSLSTNVFDRRSTVQYTTGKVEHQPDYEPFVLQW